MGRFEPDRFGRMVLIDPAALDELAHQLQAGARTVREVGVSARSRLLATGQDGQAAALTYGLEAAGTGLELLAGDLSARSTGIRHAERTLLARVARLSAPVPAASATCPPPLPITEVWERLRRLHRLRPTAERLARVGLSTASDLMERSAACLTSQLSISDWQQIARLEAGLRNVDWNPELGLAANDGVVQAVYDFYARLQLAEPDFQWAGMAATVGAMFYAGWQDLHAVRRLPDDGTRRRFLNRMIDPRPLPGLLRPGLLRPGLLTQLTAAELEWLEVRMLSMQKEIFDDLAWMHVAYRYGGLEALLPRLVGSDHTSARIAWIDIATGEPGRVAAGNARLLRREQLEIIQDDYDRIRAHNGAGGEALTRFLTWTADSAIPGARPYREAVTHTIEIPMAGFDQPQLWPPWEMVPVRYEPVVITLPRGNIADFEARWEWIESDLLPAYLALHARREHLEELLSVPVVDRARGERALPSLPYPTTWRPVPSES